MGGGRTWAKCFLKRYAHIKVRWAKILSIAHAMAANEVNIQNWFREYEQVVKKLGIVSPEQIWSGDETGVQNVPKEDKFLGEVKKPLHKQVSADQGETSTVLTFVNAVGRVCPSMMIHKGQCVQREWATNMPVSV